MHSNVLLSATSQLPESSLYESRTQITSWQVRFGFQEGVRPPSRPSSDPIIACWVADWVAACCRDRPAASSACALVNGGRALAAHVAARTRWSSGVFNAVPRSDTPPCRAGRNVPGPIRQADAPIARPGVRRGGEARRITRPTLPALRAPLTVTKLAAVLGAPLSTSSRAAPLAPPPVPNRSAPRRPPRHAGHAD